MAFHPIDVQVGQRIRDLRIKRGLTQTELANELELSFQQVQKYERGANRVSASKLHTVSQVLGVQVEYFFEKHDDAEPVRRTTLSLNRAFNEIEDRDIQVAVVDMVRAIAKAQS